ncbi:MAG TPA: DUF4397 domain-containing protein [Mucilaginibacter sp.]|jgi:hypothetical protein
MNIRCSILIFIGVITGFVSCKNNDNVFKTVIYTHINIVNASADTLNFYLNGTRQNNTSSIYPTSQSFYLTVPGGTQNYQFKKAGGFTALFNMPLNLKDSTNYSLYVAGETTDQAFSTIDTLLKDTVQNMSLVRFVNASPDAGSLGVTVGDTVNFKTRPFKSSSVFLPVGSSGLKEIRIYLAGSSIPKIDTTVAIEPNKTYTLFSKGLLNGKSNIAFGLGVAINVD